MFQTNVNERIVSNMNGQNVKCDSQYKNVCVCVDSTTRWKSNQLAFVGHTMDTRERGRLMSTFNQNQTMRIESNQVGLCLCWFVGWFAGWLVIIQILLQFWPLSFYLSSIFFSLFRHVMLCVVVWVWIGKHISTMKHDETHLDSKHVPELWDEKPREGKREREKERERPSSNQTNIPQRQGMERWEEREKKILMSLYMSSIRAIVPQGLIRPIIGLSLYRFN